MKRMVWILLACMAFAAPSYAQTAKETVKLYNPEANAQADIASAVAKAKKEGKHVFIQVGGNWCPWCIAFHKLVDATPELKTLLQDNYETVLVNYSKENKNEAVMASLGYPGRFGYPVFVILDSNGQRLHTQNSAYLEEGKGHSVKKVSEFLTGWAPAALKPENNK